ncbi:MAG: hypothetical protein ACKOWL_01235 [Sphingobacteriaceae bacterium]
MKKYVLGCMILLGIVSSSYLRAQVKINININSQPLWGPVGFDRADYYYFPDIDVYYHVSQKQFVYLDKGRWIFSPNLPHKYGYYNLYRGYKVVLNEPTPYLNFKNNRVKYAKYKGWSGKQRAIRDSDDPKYYGVNGHPHNKPPGKEIKIHKTEKIEQTIIKHEQPRKGKKD